MAATRFTTGPVTVTLDGALEGFVRRAVEKAGGEVLRLMESAAEEVAAEARADWYAPGTGVTRRTGTSGDIRVVTTVSDNEVRVSVGSTDLQKAIYVHRPGRFATKAREITQGEYSAAKREGGVKAALVFHARRTSRPDGVEAGRYYRRDASTLASDGKYLIPELIRSPMRAKVKAITPELGRAIANRMKG